MSTILPGVFTDLFADSANLLTPVTGGDVTADELRTTARKLFNVREC